VAQPDAVLYVGKRFRIESIRLDNGSLPLRDFIEGLGDSDKAKVLALIQLLGETGQIRNPEKCRKLTGTELFELKSFQIRILWFYAPGWRVILAHYAIKKKDRLRPEDIQKAESLKKKFFEDLKGRGEAR
jgi:hypothetical protein